MFTVVVASTVTSLLDGSMNTIVSRASPWPTGVENSIASNKAKLIQ
jgi:hypothetical protein